MYSIAETMHPELLNNTLFLRYYRQWQQNPSSVVFASIAEYLLNYGMLDEAIKVLREGLKRHPGFVSGHLVMAKVHIKRGNWEEALESTQRVLKIVPENKVAKELAQAVEVFSAEVRRPSEMKTEELLDDAETVDYAADESRIPSWETVTMANVYSAQGHYIRARKIYESILKRDPMDEAAKRGLDTLPQTEI